MSSTDQQPSHESSAPGSLPNEPVPPVRPFSPGVTLLCTALLCLLGLLFLSVLVQESQLDMFEQPMTLTARYFDRELEMVDASPDASSWDWRLQRLIFALPTDIQDEAIRELDAALEAHANGVITATPAEALRLEGRLAMILAEAGKRDLLRTRLDILATRGPEGALLAELVRFAYGVSDERPAGKKEVEAALALLREEAHPGATWATDRLTSRVFRRLGDEPEARAADERILERGTRALTHALWLSGSIVALMLAGLTLWATRLWLRKPWPRLSSGVSPAPWSDAEGYDMVVRSGIFGLGLLFLYSFLLSLLVSDAAATRQPFGSLLGALPMLYYLTRRVPVVHGTRLSELFGFRLHAPAMALLIATLMLIAFEQVAAVGASALGQQRWFEGVPERVLLGSHGELVVLFLDMVLWAPLLEEIACRGLIYTSLRTRLDSWNSALVSAVFFTLPHMYSPIVAMGLFLGAVASAVVYERTRSLLPCIVAHAVNNALVFGALLVYR